MEADGPILTRTLLHGTHPSSNADMKMQRDVLDVVEAAVERVAALGHRVERIPLELPDLGMEWLLHMGAQQVCALELGSHGKRADVFMDRAPLNCMPSDAVRPAGYRRAGRAT